MNPPTPKVRAQQKRFTAYLDSLAEASGHFGSRGSAEELLHRAAVAGRAEERGTHGGAVGAGQRAPDASVVASSGGRRAVERTKGCSNGYAGTPWRRCANRSQWLPGSWRNTGFPKKGQESVGVARQYCVQLGKQENCRVAVSLSVSTARLSLPVAYRLYLPESWAEDAARRKKTGIPEPVKCQTKPRMALEQIRQAVAQNVPRGVVLAETAYGVDGQFRAGLRELPLEYAVGVPSSVSVWEPGQPPWPCIVPQ